MTADLSVATILPGHCDAPTTFATRDADHFGVSSWNSDNADHNHPWETPWIDLGGEG
jgi:hypothetical protein